MEPFKNVYNSKSVGQLATQLKSIDKSFDKTKFIKSAMNNFENMEMKARVIQISDALHQFLPGPYKKNCEIFIQSMKSKNNPDGLTGFILWPYSHYIESYGLEDFNTSMKALYELTQRFTSEWGIRPFLEEHPEKVYKTLNVWVKDSNEHIRRLVSEGTRPNLPWGKKISHIEKQFNNNLGLLEILKSDDSLYVRKSVANHMNDITRYNSKLALKTLKKWSKSSSPEIQWVCKQALRTLLKQGNPEALKIMGFDNNITSKVSPLKISKKKVKDGDSFDFEFSIQNTEKRKHNYMVDYIIYYPKARGQLSPKTFKLKNISLNPGEKQKIKKNVSFKKVTTRTHYKGTHQLHIQVNGTIKAKINFELV